MLALVPLFGNPTNPKKKSKRNPKGQRGSRTNRRRRKNMAKKRKNSRRRRNPLSTQHVQQRAMRGAMLGVGAIVTKAVMNNLPLPASVQGGAGEALATAGIALGLGIVCEKVGALSKYADDVADGGIALAVFKLGGPQILPSLAFTAQAQTHAAVQVQAQALQAAAQATVAATAAATPPAGTTVPPAAAAAVAASQGTSGVGDAFVLSRGGITTADRAPRDTAALAGIGDAYAKERPGFSGGAPNGLRAPWSQSIYSR
jgi:hypothetical protein